MDQEANSFQNISQKDHNSLESLFKLAFNFHQHTPKHSAKGNLRQSR